MSELLTPCPLCSSRYDLRSPRWNYARNTSYKRDVRCYIWVGGCAHGVAFYNNDREPISDEAAITEIETRWTERVLALFTDLTANWTPAQRGLHARTIGITLPPETPAQPEPKTEQRS